LGVVSNRQLPLKMSRTLPLDQVHMTIEMKAKIGIGIGHGLGLGFGIGIEIGIALGIALLELAKREDVSISASSWFCTTLAT